MKMRYFLTLLFLSITTFLSAQIWTAEVPYKTTFGLATEIRDFIKTDDNGFLVLIQTRDSTATFNKSLHTMIKYNAEGELEWNKSYDLGVDIPNPFTNNGGVSPIEVIQLSNDNYFMKGQSVKDTVNSFYIFVTNSTGDSLSFQTTEDFHNAQLVNNRIWALRRENLQQSFLSELDELGNLVGEYPMENTNSLNLLVTPNESVFTRTNLFFRKHNLVGEMLTEQDTDYVPRFFANNELEGMTAFGEKFTKLDANLNIIWELEYDDLYPWANTSITPNYKGLFRTTSDDYIFYGSVYDDFFLDFRFPYIYKYSKDGEYIWGGTYSMNTLPYTYVAGVVEVEDGIVTIGGNVFDEKIQLVKLYPNGLGVPTNTTDLPLPKTDFHVFPNPVNNQLTIDFTEAITGQIQLINAQGKIMITENIAFSEIHKMSLQDYPVGLYVVKVRSEEGFFTSQIITKE